MVIIRGWGCGGIGEMLSKGEHLKLVDRTSLVVQWLRIHLPMQETQVWSLFGELRSHMPQALQQEKPVHCKKKKKKDMPHNKHPAQPKLKNKLVDK